jgi:hypothetical protein
LGVRNSTFYILLTSLALTTTLSAGTAVTMQHNDTSRTGANLSETQLTKANVTVNQFGKLFSRSVDGQIYAQPLYLPGVQIPGQGTHNVVYVATEHNSLYAFDADLPAATGPLWHDNFGTPILCSQIVACDRDLVPEIGITSTPVIDPATNTIYAVAETWESGKTYFRLHALDVTTGNERPGSPAVLQGSVPGTGAESVSGLLAFDPYMHWQRAGLLIWNGTVYIGFGSHQDSQPYHGWMFAVDEKTLQITALRCLSPNADSAGVWQGGAAPPIDASGNIYVQTGHGLQNGLAGGNFGISMVKLSTANGLAPVDFFSPSNWLALSNDDNDMGASGSILIPGTHYMVGGGKDGRLFLLDSNNMGQFDPAANHSLQEWDATYGLLQTGAGGIFGGNVWYNNTLYLWGRRDVLKAFHFDGSRFQTTPVSTTLFGEPDGYSSEPALAISANGNIPGSGILWATRAQYGPADGLSYPGILDVFDATDLTKELWNSEQNSARDRLGSWAKWVAPTIVNGKVYVATFDNVLNVYGLLSAAPQGTNILASQGTPQSTILNTAFPAALQAAILDPSKNPLSGVTVTFTAPVGGATASFAGSATASAVTNSSGIATAPTLTANSQTGGFTVIATVAGSSAEASFNLTNTAPAATGSLVGMGNSSAAGINLTLEGSADWVEWDLAGTNRKARVTQQISNVTAAGASAVLGYNNDPRPIAWSDGGPVSIAGNDFGGLFTTGLQNGFVITAPADLSLRNLTLHVGGWNSGATLTVHLSDASAADFIDVAPIATSQYDRNYTLTYAAGHTGQTLTIRWIMTSGTGNVTVNAAALAAGGSLSGAASSSATPVNLTLEGTADWAQWDLTGTNRKAGVTPQIGNALPVTGAAVLRYNNDPRPIGWTDGNPTPASTTDLGGLFTAGLQNGFAITAPADLNARTLNIYVGGWNSGGTLTAQLSDNSAATFVEITPTAPGQYDRNYTLTYAAGRAGQTLTVSWIMTSGTGNVTVNAAALALGGSLSGLVSSNPTPVNITLEGNADWVQWDLTGTNRKAGLTPQISDAIPAGGGVTPEVVLRYNNDPRPIGWSDGNPLPTAANDFGGMFTAGLQNGFVITAPADLSSRTLHVHVGGWNSGATLTAHLSDASGADFVDVTPTASGQYDRDYTLTYMARHVGQTLTVSWKMTSGTGNVTVNAAALAR